MTRPPDSRLRRRPPVAEPLYDRVYARIRDMVASGEFRADEPVSEVRLSETLEVSRTPVREAVRRLVGENVLQLTPQGLRAYTPSIEDLAEVYYTRAVLEGGAARLAAVRGDRAMIGALKKILREAQRHLGDLDHEAFARLNGEFHRALLDGSRSRRIRDLLASLEMIVVRYRRISLMFPEQVRRSCEDHARIVELLESGTPAAVENFVRDHVLRAGARTVRTMLRMEGREVDPESTAATLLALDQAGELEPAAAPAAARRRAAR